MWFAPLQSIAEIPPVHPMDDSTILLASENRDSLLLLISHFSRERRVIGAAGDCDRDVAENRLSDSAVLLGDEQGKIGVVMIRCVDCSISDEPCSDLHFLALQPRVWQA